MKIKHLAALATLVISACTPAEIRNNQLAETVYPPTLSSTALPILPVLEGASIIPVQINGQGDYRFYFDSGATPTAIFTSARIEKLGLSRDGDFNVSGTGDDGAAAASFADPIDLGIGAATIVGMTPVVLRWQDMAFMPTQRAAFIDGIFGMDIMTRFAVDVDMEQRSLRLHPPGEAIPDLPNEVIRLPLKRKGGDLFVQVMVRVKGDDDWVDAQLQLDTGASEAMTLIAGRHPSFEVPGGSNTATGLGVSGESTVYATVIDAVKFGPTTFANVPISFSETPDPFMGRHGRLGARLLNRFRYIVNLPGQELILIPRANTTAPLERFATAGMGLAAIGDDFDRLAIIGLEEDGPAAKAGLNSGDIVVSVGGIAAPELARRGVTAALSGKSPGDSISVCREPDSEGGEPESPACLDVILAAR